MRPVKVKKGCGQRKSRRDKAGRIKHAEHTKREMVFLELHGKVTLPPVA